MTTTSLPRIPTNTDMVKVIVAFNAAMDELDYQLGGFLDWRNISRFANFAVNKDDLKHQSGVVGISGADPNNPDAIRFYAGADIGGNPNFKVTQAGIASMVSAIISSVASGERVVIDETGLHCFDASNVERLTIGTTVAKGVKAITCRDTAGDAQSVYTYDTETVDGASRTGQYITAHGAYLLISDDGDIRFQSAAGHGFRSIGGRPEINDGFGWAAISKKSEVDALEARVSALEAGP